MTLRVNGSVLYTNNDANTFDEIWDDTELIKLYEKSISHTLDKIQNSADSTDESSAHQKQQTKNWKKGDICMAPYVEDGMWYKAKIESLSKSECKIRFTEYNTKATVKIEELMTEEDVEWVAETEEMEQEENGQLPTTIEKNRVINIEPTTSTSNGKGVFNNVLPVIPNLCPPPPPSLFDKIIVAGSEKEALTNALMGWYMAGYHTGFYQGLKHERMKQSNQHE